jgi:23S rRNA (uracil1939-C5)-methyltransferase
MGNFSIPLSIQGSAVLGIERHTDCIEQAQNTASRSGLNNSRFLDRDVHKWISREAKRSNEYIVIILDPPRQGMGNNIVQLAELAPSKIIYISCDPATLARDIALLYNKRYVLTSITPVDMFPQTHHIESVALLEKN